MRLSKNKKKLIFISFLLLLAGTTVSLSLYAKPVHAALVGYSTMEEVATHVYVEPDLDSSTQDELMEHIASANAKVSAVFGERSSNPYLIYVESPKALEKYADNPTGQTYYYPWNNYIVIGPRGLNANVIAHEITHAELRTRLHNQDKVPAWFDEGLATMIDGRYSGNEAVWERVTNYGADSYDYDLLDSNQAFRYGEADTLDHYNLACYEVSRWFEIVGTEGLLGLIHDLNEGMDFKERYQWLESDS